MAAWTEPTACCCNVTALGLCSAAVIVNDSTVLEHCQPLKSYACLLMHQTALTTAPMDGQNLQTCCCKSKVWGCVECPAIVASALVQALPIAYEATHMLLTGTSGRAVLYSWLHAAGIANCAGCSALLLNPCSMHTASDTHPAYDP